MKKYIVAFALLLIVGVTTAFTVRINDKAPKQDPTAQEWFIFNGVAGQENDATKYSFVAMDPDCDNIGTKRCAVFATPQTANPTRPNLGLPYTPHTKQ
ncbi:MAG: hypothetical protein H7Y31_16625 [Chitinophagaceae bacterium]|nr:hypothetical protein [Chitinophagaceae bacterium]